MPGLDYLVPYVEAALAVRAHRSKPTPYSEKPCTRWRLNGLALREAEWAVAGIALAPTLRDAPLKRESYFARSGAIRAEGFAGTVRLPGARDSSRAIHGDDRASGVARPQRLIMTYREMLALEGIAA
ncbi:hypothetical protein [Reyranella massiliensis]|uniref:hypothetical protein n=1 Tax=Reyranella massiliensis TaxID=445220 RepID=UPI0011D1B97C|nr:hypothetical protein [Reyranella massiliensis]